MKHKIVYCDQCEVWTTVCPSCGMGGCSGGHQNFCECVEESMVIDLQLENLLCNTNLCELLNANV